MIHSFFPGYGIPVLVAVHLGMLFGVDNRSKGGGDDDSLHRRCMGLDCLQNARGPLDGGVEEILDGILDIEVEWRSSVQDIVEGRVRFDSLRY